jgi:putative ABC transport system permease protein
MRMQDQSVSDRAYRLLLRALPFDFRGDFGSDMEEVFRAQRADVARTSGGLGMLALWWETVVGIFTTAPREHLSILSQDVSHAMRMMRREWGHTALAVIILGLGIGANTALFSVINAILLRPLPYPRGGDLVLIRQTAPKADIRSMPFSVAEIDDYRGRNQTFQAIAEYHSMLFMLLGEGETERVRTGVVSSDFFDIFGVKPVLGRGFQAADDKPRAAAVLLMSNEYWQRRGADPNIVGKRVRMNDREHVVIGVLPPLPQYPNENDVFMTTSACPFRSAPRFVSNRNSRMMQLFGRLKPNVTLEQARADLAGIAKQLEREYPDSYPAVRGYEIAAAPLKQELTQRAKPMLWLLMGAASFVLLIACANVANLMLARVARREHEVVVRSAMGAANSRLLRQFLTENLIMAALAASVGVLFAWGSMQLLTDFASRLSPRAREISLDQTVLLYAIAVAILTTVVFGSLAALSRRKDLSSGLQDNHMTWAPGRVRLRNILVTCQVTFSFVLLTGAGLMARSVIKLQQADPGFAAQNVLAVGINLNWSHYSETQDRRDLGARIIERLRAQPEVTSAALSSSFPFDPDLVAYGGWRTDFQIEAVTSGGTAAVRIATPDYFRTLDVPLLTGRPFSDADNERGAEVAIVNRQFAHRYWGDTNPAIGKRLSMDHGEHWVTIVGVAGDVKEFGPNREAPDEVYRPAAQFLMPIGAVLVRSTADAETVAALVRRVIRSLDPEIAVTPASTFDQARDDSIRINTITANLLGLFALVALAIAVTGVGGILALSVSRRVREIAIRMALGAKRTQVLRMIIGQGMAQVLIGLALGWVGAAMLTRVLNELLFEVTPTDPATFWGVSILLLFAAMIACYLPARRATHIDPQTALRSD